MNNQELIRTLDRDLLLSVVEILSRALIFEDDEFDDLGVVFPFPDEVWDYCKSLTGYERLKLIQLIINTLIGEAEQSSMQDFQTSLPLATES